MGNLLKKYKSISFWLMIILPVLFISLSIVIMNSARDKKVRVAVNVALITHLKSMESVFQHIAINSEGDNYDDPLMKKRMDYQAMKLRTHLDSTSLLCTFEPLKSKVHVKSLDSLSYLIWDFQSKLLLPYLTLEQISLLEEYVKDASVRSLNLTGESISFVRANIAQLSKELNDLWNELLYLLLAAIGLAVTLVASMFLYMDRRYGQLTAEASLVESESRNRALVNAIPDMMFRIGKDGTYIDFKPSNESLSVFSSKELIGKKIEDYFPKRLVNQAYNKINTALNTGEVQSWEYEYEFGGKLLEFEARIVKSNHAEVIATVRDFTEKKRVTRALKQSEERYSLAVNAGNVGVWDWNLKTNELYIDPIVKAMLGYKDYEIRNVAEAWNKHALEEDVEKVNEEVRAHLAKEKPSFTVEHRMAHKDGSVVWLLTHGVSLLDEKKKPYRMLGTHTNITRIKVVEDKLIISEARWRSIFENVDDIVISIDKRGRILSMNKEAEGYTIDQMIGQDIFTFLMPTDKDWAKIGVLNVFETMQLFKYELEFKGKDGSIIWYSCIATPTIKENIVDSVIIVCRDVTEKRIADIALKANERRLNLALETAKMGTWELNFITDKVTWSKNAEEIFGLESGAFHDTYDAYLAMVHPEDVGLVEKSIKKVIKNGKNYSLEHRVVLVNRKIVWLYCKGQVIRNDDKESNRLVGTIMDITQLKEAEKAVINAVIQGQDTERKRVAEELHDGVGQILSSLNMNFNALKLSVESGKLIEQQVNVENIQSLLLLAVSEVRTISHNLMPDLLEEFGLVPAMNNMVSKFGNVEILDIKLETINVDGNKRFEAEVETAIYRITQELINNIIKHSKATTAFVQLINHEDSIVLVVEDDGVGFDVKSKKSGIGLRNIASRTKLLNGELMIDSTKGMGTVFTIEIPLAVPV